VVVNVRVACIICGRRLNLEGDPLSIDCGGDCWGCVGEAELGGDLTDKVMQEIVIGLRNADGSAADRNAG
jgi:hypothetical protein